MEENALERMPEKKISGSSFHGGVHPPQEKASTNERPVRVAELPEQFVVPMSLHIGAPANPIVKKGDVVFLGQKIGEASGFVSANIHSPVSGTVAAVEKRPHPNGNNVMSVIIDNDGLDTVYPDIVPYGDYEQYSGAEIIDIIREAGIVGMGGATFPTHVKLTIPEDKQVDTLIINGAECEPYLTADDHLMREHPEKVIYGLKIGMKAIGVSKGTIAVEDNKPEAIEKLLHCLSAEKDIAVVALKTKYPQGAEKQLITAVTGREVPSGGLPADAGVVVMNAATAAQIAETFETGLPLYKRLLTCTGDAVAEPCTIEARIGMMYQDIIDQCGGFKEAPAKVISGGPMMGVSLFDTAVPVMKGTSGILCLSAASALLPQPTACIRCGKCAGVCPVRLQPLFLSAYADQRRWDKCEAFHALDCIECGSCVFICPAKRTLLSSIRVAKRQIAAQRQQKKAR